MTHYAGSHQGYARHTCQAFRLSSSSYHIFAELALCTIAPARTRAQACRLSARAHMDSVSAGSGASTTPTTDSTRVCQRRALVRVRPRSLKRALTTDSADARARSTTLRRPRTCAGRLPHVRARRRSRTPALDGARVSALNGARTPALTDLHVRASHAA
jgi:hypothetical protein